MYRGGQYKERRNKGALQSSCNLVAIWLQFGAPTYSRLFKDYEAFKKFQKIISGTGVVAAAMSISLQRDSAVDAGDGDRRAAVADASAQLALLHLADDGDRQGGFGAPAVAVDIDFRVWLGPHGHFLAPLCPL